MVAQGGDGAQPQFGGRRRRAALALALVATLALLLPAAGSAVGSAGRTAPLDAVGSTRAEPAAARAYELVSRTDSARPVRWPACRAIEYRINRHDMPAGMDAVVRRTMGIVSRQTGVAFRYAGSTKRTFGDRSRGDRPTILIAFTTRSEAYGQTFAWPGEIGVGGPLGGWYRSGDGDTYEAITGGRVLLSTRFRAPRLGAGVTWQSLILHEVGHTLNLAHRDSPTAVMHATLTERSPARFSAPEVAALHRTLQRTGCDWSAWHRL